MSEETINRLRQVPIFSGLDENQLADVMKMAGRRVFEAGTPIVQRGKEAHAAFFLILSGRVEVRREGQLLSELGAGQFFGEMSLFDNQPRSADVIPTADTECLVIARWNLEQVIKRNPEIAMQMLGELSRRLREAQQQSEP